MSAAQLHLFGQLTVDDCASAAEDDHAAAAARIAEGQRIDRQARGEAIPGAPGACTRPGCAHPMIWHEHANRNRPCERCDCGGFQRGAAAAEVEQAAPRPGTPEARPPSGPRIFQYLIVNPDAEGPARIVARRRGTHAECGLWAGRWKSGGYEVVRATVGRAR
jgi:hypothetical protein